MQTVRFIDRQEGEAWIGYLRDHADYWTHGESLEDLKEHLRNVHHSLTSGELPDIRRVDELVAA